MAMILNEKLARTQLDAMAIFSWLSRGLSRSTRTSDGDAEARRVTYLKRFVPTTVSELANLDSELDGGNIILVDLARLFSFPGTRGAVVELKRALDQLKIASRRRGGSVARIGDYLLVVTPDDRFILK